MNQPDPTPLLDCIARIREVTDPTPLLDCIARIREVTGVGAKPTLAELPEAIRQRMTVRPSLELIDKMIRSGK